MRIIFIIICIFNTLELRAQNPYFNLYFPIKGNLYSLDNCRGKGISKWDGKQWNKLNDTLYSSSFARNILSKTNKDPKIINNSFELLNSGEVKDLGDMFPSKQAIRYYSFALNDSGIFLFGQVVLIKQISKGNFSVKNLPFVVDCTPEFKIRRYYIYFNTNLSDNSIKPKYMVSSFPATSIGKDGFIFPLAASINWNGKSDLHDAMNGRFDGIGAFRLNLKKKVFYLDSVFEGGRALCSSMDYTINDNNIKTENVFSFSNIMFLERNKSFYSFIDNVPIVCPLNAKNQQIFYQTSLYKTKPCYVDSMTNVNFSSMPRNGNKPYPNIPTRCFWVENRSEGSVFFIWNSKQSSIEIIRMDGNFKVLTSKLISIEKFLVPVLVEKGNIVFIHEKEERVEKMAYIIP